MAFVLMTRRRATDYVEVLGVVRGLMLPEYAIPEVFHVIKERAEELVAPLLKYVQSNWIVSQRWGPAAWTVFNKTVRTNNDAEGLHHLWNTGYNGSLVPFYALVAKIAGISKTVETEMRLVAADKLTRRQRPADSRKTEILFQIWNKISEGLLEPLEAHQCFMQMNT